MLKGTSSVDEDIGCLLGMFTRKRPSGRLMIGEDSLSLSLSLSSSLLPPGRLTETMDGLQSQAEELQRELEDVKAAPPQRAPPPGDTRSTHSVSCLQELQSTLR